MMRFRAEVVEELARHGLRPGPSTSPEKLREQVNDLYRYEIRKLRDRCRAGEFSTRELPARVVELRKSYVLLSIPLAQWTADDRDATVGVDVSDCQP
jgi:hypothetical protein